MIRRVAATLSSLINCCNPYKKRKRNEIESERNNNQPNKKRKCYDTETSTILSIPTTQSTTTTLNTKSTTSITRTTTTQSTITFNPNTHKNTRNVTLNQENRKHYQDIRSNSVRENRLIDFNRFPTYPMPQTQTQKQKNERTKKKIASIAHKRVNRKSKSRSNPKSKSRSNQFNQERKTKMKRDTKKRQSNQVQISSKPKPLKLKPLSKQQFHKTLVQADYVKMCKRYFLNEWMKNNKRLTYQFKIEVQLKCYSVYRRLLYSEKYEYADLDLLSYEYDRLNNIHSLYWSPRIDRATFIEICMEGMKEKNERGEIRTFEQYLRDTVTIPRPPPLKKRKLNAILQSKICTKKLDTNKASTLHQSRKRDKAHKKYKLNTVQVTASQAPNSKQSQIPPLKKPKLNALQSKICTKKLDARKTPTVPQPPNPKQSQIPKRKSIFANKPFKYPPNETPSPQILDLFRMSSNNNNQQKQQKPYHNTSPSHTNCFQPNTSFIMNHQISKCNQNETPPPQIQQNNHHPSNPSMSNVSQPIMNTNNNKISQQQQQRINAHNMYNINNINIANIPIFRLSQNNVSTSVQPQQPNIINTNNITNTKTLIVPSLLSAQKPNNNAYSLSNIQKPSQILSRRNNSNDNNMANIQSTQQHKIDPIRKPLPSKNNPLGIRCNSQTSNTCDVIPQQPAINVNDTCNNISALERYLRTQIMQSAPPTNCNNNNKKPKSKNVFNMNNLISSLPSNPSTKSDKARAFSSGDQYYRSPAVSPQLPALKNDSLEVQLPGLLLNDNEQKQIQSTTYYNELNIDDDTTKTIIRSFTDRQPTNYPCMPNLEDDNKCNEDIDIIPTKCYTTKIAYKIEDLPSDKLRAAKGLDVMGDLADALPSCEEANINLKTHNMDGTLKEPDWHGDDTIKQHRKST